MDDTNHVKTLKRMQRPVVSFFNYLLIFIVFTVAIFVINGMENSQIYLSILVFILLTGYIHRLFYKVMIYKNSIKLRTLTSKKEILYHSIMKIEVSNQKQTQVIALYLNDTKWIQHLPMRLLGTKEEQKDFIQFLLQQNPSIEVGRQATRLLHDEPLFSVSINKKH